MGLDLDKTIQLLRHYKWNNDKLMEAWLNNENKLRIQAGFTLDPNLLKEFPYLN